MKHNYHLVQRSKKFFSGMLYITFLSFCYSITVTQESTESIEFLLTDLKFSVITL